MTPLPSLSHLTPRERQVAQLIAAGASNKEIADKLNISEHTAKFHVRQAAAKFGVKLRTETAVAYVLATAAAARPAVSAPTRCTHARCDAPVPA